jgi:hypothetical protein
MAAFFFRSGRAFDIGGDMRTWTKKTWITVLVLACLLLAFRFSLSHIAKVVVNRQLLQLNGYSGHIDGIGISLWRGAYQIKGLAIVKKEGLAPVPFFSARSLDIGLQWKALFHRRLVATVLIRQGQLNFVNGPSPQQGQSGRGEDWGQLLKSLVPLKINRFQLQDSEVHFRDPFGKPPVDVHLEALDLVAEELSSREAGLGTVSATARVMQDARLALQARFNPFAPAPTFDYGITLEGLKLDELNPLLLRYVGMDVQAGSLDLYSEAAAAEGKFKGYVKPMVKGLKMMKPHEAFDVPKLLKKALAGAIGWIFRNERQQVATKFEFAGEFKDPHTSLWGAAVHLFKNAFVEALPPRLDAPVKVEELLKKAG